MAKRRKNVNKTKELFCICPQNFIGPARQKFIITAEDLINLHKLPKEQCVIQGESGYDKTKKYTYIRAKHKDVVRLFPEEFKDFIEAHAEDFPDLVKGADEKEEFHGFDEVDS